MFPESGRAIGAYAPAVVDRRWSTSAGQLPRIAERVAVAGAVVDDVTMQEAIYGARLALLRSLAILQADAK